MLWWSKEKVTYHSIRELSEKTWRPYYPESFWMEQGHGANLDAAATMQIDAYLSLSNQIQNAS